MDFSKIQLLSFDCYGTLVDWKKGVLDILVSFLAPHQLTITREQLFALFLQEDQKQITGEYQPYREILARIMDGITRQLEIGPGQADRYLLSGHFDMWLPFPDTVENLKKLRERYKLAIISNVDDDLFSISNRLLEVEFDYIVTAGQLRNYKPSPFNFETALKRFGLDKNQVLHVAQSIHHDIIPSNKLDWNNVWVNRYGEPERTDPAEFPDLEVPDLASLIRIISLELPAAVK